MVSSPMNIVFTYLAYPVSMARYMLDALRRRDDVNLFVIAPFSGTWIPWMGGMHLPGKYVSAPDSPLAIDAELVYPWAENQLPWKPDLWIEGNAGLKTYGQPKTGRYVVIGTDPHVIDYDRSRDLADVFFCMQKPYSKPGDVWLPYAYDPVWHTPSQKLFADRELDISLIGLMYEHRMKLMEALRAKGHAVHIGTGAAYDEAREIYHDSVCGLNWSSRLDTTARCFELMAFGVVPILNRTPDLVEMFKDGEHFLGFDSQDEAVSQIESVLDDHDKAKKISESAIEAVKPHTWDARMQFVLEQAGML